MRTLLSLAAMISSLIFLALPATAGTMTRINAGATATIDAHGTCRKVKNNNGAAVMIPHGTAGEWVNGANAFLAGNRPGLTVSSCGVDLSGLADCPYGVGKVLFHDPNPRTGLMGMATLDVYICARPDLSLALLSTGTNSFSWGYDLAYYYTFPNCKVGQNCSVFSSQAQPNIDYVDLIGQQLPSSGKVPRGDTAGWGAYMTQDCSGGVCTFWTDTPYGSSPTTYYHNGGLYGFSGGQVTNANMATPAIANQRTFTPAGAPQDVEGWSVAGY